MTKTKLPPKICSVDGCDKISTSLTYCREHYYYFKRYGNPAHPRVNTKPGTTNPCSVPDCDRPAKALSLCTMHYSRIKTHGTTTTQPAVKSTRICSAPECTEKHSALGYCKMHYRLFVRYGKPCKPPRQTGCRIDGCQNSHYGKGLCNKHWNRQHKTGTTELIIPAPKICSVDNCDRNAHSNGMCMKHDQRMRKNGSIELICKTPPGAAIALLRNLANNPPHILSCVEWPYHINAKGYGVVDFEGKGNRLAHRVSRILYSGINPSRDVYACHKCGNPACVHPLHTYWGDAKSNSLDAINHGTYAHGEKSGGAKLSELDVLNIRADNRTLKEIALDYPVGYTAIGAIKSRKTWKHLP